MTSPATRSPLLPASAIPLAYFALAHAALAAGLLILIAMPALPGGFFYHPKMVALTHFLTLGWLSGSILGAFYIAAPLALGCPMPPRRADWVACVSYAIGLVGMIAHFWIAEYRGMAWSAAMVTGAIAWVGFRGWRGLSASRAPWPIALHVRLAFLNVLAAAGVGILLGLDRAVGLLTVSPLAVTYAHAHLAAIGWVGLMVVGFSYRLVPMMLPCAMPTGRALAWSAVLIESGLAVVAAALVAGSSWLPLGAVLIGAGFVSAARHLRRAILQPRPRPPLLPATDWSLWQVGGAFVWLVVAMTLGLVMSTGATIDFWYVETAWVYGVAGLVGWQGQMVAGVQGRLVPLYAWYRALARRNGAPPDISVHELPAPRLAAVVFGAWTAGVPLLAAGLAAEQETLIRTAAVLLFTGVLAGAAHIGVMLRRAQPRLDRARPRATAFLARRTTFFARLTIRFVDFFVRATALTPRRRERAAAFRAFFASRPAASTTVATRSLAAAARSAICSRVSASASRASSTG